MTASVSKSASRSSAPGTRSRSVRRLDRPIAGQAATAGQVAERLADDHLYQEVMRDLKIDPEKVNASAKRITHSGWDEILDTSEHKAIPAKKRKHS